jgi:hypothetical protein
MHVELLLQMEIIFLDSKWLKLIDLNTNNIVVPSPKNLSMMNKVNYVGKMIENFEQMPKN